jgi:oligopeptide/dipeptide ABC transporter ATP-binding protein
MSADILLDIRKLKMHFPITQGVLRRKCGEVRAVEEVSLTLCKGEVFGLCGESGSGKSTLAQCILRLYAPASGSVLFDGIDISHAPERELKEIRSRMSLVFQDPSSALDPRQRIRNIVIEPLLVRRSIRKSDCDEKARQLLKMVELDASLLNRYPHELSGGQRQRVGIARALASDPRLIIFDEPVSALDVSIQAQILNLLRDIHYEREELSYLFISHDLSVIQNMSDRVAVMYMGRIIEIGQTIEVYGHPLHPYTQMLLSAAVIGNPFLEAESSAITVEDVNVAAAAPTTGCAFKRRCSMAVPECDDYVPMLHPVGGSHEVACIRIQIGADDPAGEVKKKNFSAFAKSYSEAIAAH